MSARLDQRGLDALALDAGKHDGPESGACLLEAVSWWAGEEWSDHPSCVSPVLAAFGRSLNDRLPDDRRQALKPLAPLLVGTVDPVADQRDGLRCAHHLMAVWVPAWLDLVPALAPHAARLRALPAPASWDDVQGWRPAWDAAWDAARDAAWDAAGDAARDAAGAAAWDAARDALVPTRDELRDGMIRLFTDLVHARRIGASA